MQKTFQIKSLDHQNILEQVLTPILVPKDDEVLIKHTAIGVNFADYELLRGAGGVIKESLIPGIEAVGTIEQKGKNTPNFTIGQKVGYATVAGGAYSEYRTIKASYLFPIPDVISDESAALNLVKGMTAHLLMKRTFFLKEGMTIMIHGAASNVGRLMMRLAREYKINVIATVGDDRKKQIVKDLKAIEVFNYINEDFVQGVQDLTKRKGVHVVYDFIGRDMLKKSLKCLTNFGLAVSAGNASGRAAPIDPALLINRGIFLATPRLNWYKQEKPELMMSVMEICTLIAAKIFPAVADKKYSFDQIPDALNDIAERTTNSRVIML
jgi:NADPH2:quinone reductase